jgi:serine/threonine-protein phosphatase 2A regulatory subunit B
VTNTEVLLAARCKKVYANAHTYHINSISVNSDQETFLSADDLRVNLWNLVWGGGWWKTVCMYEGSVGHDCLLLDLQEVTEQSFNIVDIKPSNMEDLTEVTTPT